MHQEQPMRAGSGSLYTKEFLPELQSRKVKIVICCLEFKFFKRSLSELPKAYEMLRQQLFLADSIHFLTAHDKSNFEKTLDALKTNTKLYPHKLVPFQSEQLARFDLEKDIKGLGGIAWPVANAEAVVVIPELCHFLGHDCAPTSHADR